MSLPEPNQVAPEADYDDDSDLRVSLLLSELEAEEREAREKEEAMHQAHLSDAGDRSDTVGVGARSCEWMQFQDEEPSQPLSRENSGDLVARVIELTEQEMRAREAREMEELDFLFQRWETLDEWDGFISHCQAEGGSLAMAIFCTGRGLGVRLWLDVGVTDRSEKGMEHGVRNSSVVYAVLSTNFFNKPYCVQELRWARQYGKRVIPLISAEDANEAHAIFSWCPDDLVDLFLDGEKPRPVNISCMRQLKLQLPATLSLQPRSPKSVDEDEPRTGFFLSSPSTCSVDEEDNRREAIALMEWAPSHGMRGWHRMYVQDKSDEAARQAMRQCEVFIVILSPRYLATKCLVDELRWAKEARLRIQPLVRVRDQDRINDFKRKCPRDLRDIFNINIHTIDVSDMRKFGATLGITLSDARSAPTYQEVDSQASVRDLRKHIAWLQETDSDGAADPSVSASARHQQRLEWLREHVPRIDAGDLERSEQHLGSGGQGIVYRAKYRGQPVALKRYLLQRHEPQAGAKEAQALTEALLLCRMGELFQGRRGVVGCSGVRHEVTDIYIMVELALELCPNGSLDQIIHSDKHPSFSDSRQWPGQRQQYAEDRWRGWVWGVADTLCWLHEDLKVTYCDMKAANVLLHSDGRGVKLADFGSCFLAKGSMWQQSISLAPEREAGGTLRYMAPERIEDHRNIVPSGDQWSFGLVVYEILWGDKAFAGLSDTDTTRDIDLMRRPPSSKAWDPSPEMRKALQPLVDHCVRTKPEDRLPVRAIREYCRKYLL